MVMEPQRVVCLTHHAIDNAIARFPAFAALHAQNPARSVAALAAWACAAEQSAEEHYIIGHGFLKGEMDAPGLPEPVPMYFAYKTEADKHIICTVLTEELLAGDGGRRK